MNAESLAAGLTTERFGRRIVFAETMASTSEAAAAALAGEDLPEGTVFVASRQTRGKGTGGNRWLSSDSEGLCVSLVLQEPIARQPLSFLPALALVDVLRERYAVSAHVKWPNDVLVEERKIAGILVETQMQPSRRTAWIVGIGVNVAQTAFDDEIEGRAVSLRMATGRRHARTELFHLLMARMEQIFDARADLVELWRQRTRMIGRRIVAQRAGRALAATVLGITPSGHLQVVLDDGAREEWVARVDIRHIEMGN
jgi:BirA family biotin operon repressor/biotin-[acetyl-CoA-carboxylase] ligase